MNTFVRLCTTVLVLAALAATAVGCQPKPAQPTPTPQQPSQIPPGTGRPADREFVSFVESFLEARMAGDASQVSAMMDKGQAGTAGFTSPVGRITAYKAAAAGDYDAETVRMVLRVAFVSPEGIGEVAVEEALVTWKSGLKIKAVIRQVNESLRVSAGPKLELSRGKETTTAAELKGLPNVFRPVGAEAGIEFGVGKEGWSVAVPSLSGQQVFWTTRGIHALLGTSRIQWGGQPAVTPLNLLFEGGVAEAAWSPSENHVALAEASPSGNTGLTLWDIPARKPERVDLKAVLLPGACEVKNLRWTAAGDAVRFDLTQGGKTTGPFTYHLSQKLIIRP